MAPARYLIQTVCTGNICRSPMAATVLATFLADAALSGSAEVGSSGVSAEEDGNAIDRRAAAALRRRGYEPDLTHRAHRITREEIEVTDLILPATFNHYRTLTNRGAHPARLKMMRQFDPAVAELEPGWELDIEDPWYGTANDFELALSQIEAACPGVVDYVREAVE
ncbi:MAG: low molecular weight phosphotyrosine protein phosphatase [Bifidobacteriaceae bacterium]|jgi:protein-tyrosine phosphatase|nr:low molecular weight phosphotyrosine protein phosphatase [Bifidobacteriaceae bacterium]